ncbi:MAG TPA: TIGR03621 family F420-dependent LLM class oxidoreductase, partial [Solirubrobacteraceae bacterium]|nr:TIGR03621 family F420-dependent LLM class oxidoreductase [Solirubrobacteraceae bacterium]
MRFGVVVGAPDLARYVAAVRRAEDLGYDVVLCSDHLDLSGRHFSHFAPIPALTAAALSAARVRIGTAVLNQDLRHPAVLAREAASLDVLSGGRLELGLGAGWLESEYRAAGIPFDPIGRRARRFAEYVQVVKGVIAEPEFSFRGEFFTIDAMPGQPPPLQHPHPPVMIGAVGPRLLRLAAREADIVSINLLRLPDPSDAALAERVTVVREAAPERFDSLELQLPLAIAPPSNRPPVDAIVAAAGAGDPFFAMLASRTDVDTLACSPMVLTGAPVEMAESLSGLSERHGIGS